MEFNYDLDVYRRHVITKMDFEFSLPSSSSEHVFHRLSFRDKCRGLIHQINLCVGGCLVQGFRGEELWLHNAISFLDEKVARVHVPWTVPMLDLKKHEATVRIWTGTAPLQPLLGPCSGTAAAADALEAQFPRALARLVLGYLPSMTAAQAFDEVSRPFLKSCGAVEVVLEFLGGLCSCFSLLQNQDLEEPRMNVELSDRTEPIEFCKMSYPFVATRTMFSPLRPSTSTSPSTSSEFEFEFETSAFLDFMNWNDRNLGALCVVLDDQGIALEGARLRLQFKSKRKQKKNASCGFFFEEKETIHALAIRQNVLEITRGLPLWRDAQTCPLVPGPSVDKFRIVVACPAGSRARTLLILHLWANEFMTFQGLGGNLIVN